MSLFKNEVGRPSNETIKKRNIFKGICVLLVMVIIGLVGYILNDKGIINLSNKNTKDGNEKVVTTVKSEHSSKISKKEALEIYESVLGKFDFNTDDLSYLNSDKYKTEFCISKLDGTNKYDSYELLKSKLKKVNGNYVYEFKDGSSVDYDNNAKVYEYNDVNKEMKNVFSGNVKAVKEDLEFYQYKYIYVKDKNVYVRLESIWGDGGHQVIADISSVTKVNNKVNIDILIADVEYIDENQYAYTGSNGKEIKFNNEDIKNYSETLKKYEKYVKKYTLTFVEKSNKYLFEAVK